MDEKKEEAVDNTATAATQTEIVDDKEARIATLETEKAKLIEERENYKVGMLKAKAQAKEEGIEPDEDERMERVARKALAESRLAEIAREQDTIITKALKENKELKLAQLNKKEPGAAVGTHSEGIPVRDTLVTPDQMAAFKSRGWDDKKIERYKKNLQRYGTR